MIRVEHLTKYYGDFLAVDDLSFEIGEGHVYGFLGPNGAGKSTTMNIMTGCLSATSGSVSIDGYDIFDQPKLAKRQIGYLPEQPPLYLHESPVEYLRFVGEAKGLRGEELQEQIADVIRQTGIEPVKNKRIGTLSKGYKQRVGIAQALLGKPGVIILDEPTVGLDPLQIIEIRDLIKELGQTHTVLFSSHILSEVQAICDKILMVAHGRLVAFDTPDNLEQQMKASSEILLTTASDRSVLEKLLSGIDYISSFRLDALPSGYAQARIQSSHDNIYEVSAAIFHACAAAQISILEMSLKRANLEDVFLELLEENKGETPHNKGKAENKT